MLFILSVEPTNYAFILLPPSRLRNAEDSVPYEETVLISGVFRRANTVRPYRVTDDFCCFSEKSEGV
ncbi:MAG: hypothetical protein ACI4IX_06500 [Acutalibacteraceae bacterium]